MAGWAGPIKLGALLSRNSPLKCMAVLLFYFLFLTDMGTPIRRAEHLSLNTPLVYKLRTHSSAHPTAVIFLLSPQSFRSPKPVVQPQQSLTLCSFILQSHASNFMEFLKRGLLCV